MLARAGFNLGPDPASKNIATVGGVIANNSGGMRCGVEWDSYSTVESMTLILASGTVIDTAAAGRGEPLRGGRARARARPARPPRGAARGHGPGRAGGRRKYRDQERRPAIACARSSTPSTPLEIFSRLVVGSEGTLAFIAEAVMRTRPEPRHRTLAWLHFATIDEAVAHVPELVDAGARAAELMVAAALIASAYQMPGTPEYWKELPFDSAALIVEFAPMTTRPSSSACERTAAKLLDEGEA